MTIRCNRISSVPLRVCGKVVILQCRWPVNWAGRKIDPTSILAEITTKNKSSYLLGAFFISFARCGVFLSFCVKLAEIHYHQDEIDWVDIEILDFITMVCKNVR